MSVPSISWGVLVWAVKKFSFEVYNSFLVNWLKSYEPSRFKVSKKRFISLNELHYFLTLWNFWASWPRKKLCKMILKSLCRENRFVLLYFTKLSCRIDLVLYSWSRNSISGSTSIIWSRAASNMIFFLLQASGIFHRIIYIKSESLEIVKSQKSECIGSHEVCQVRYISPNQKAMKLMISKLFALLQYSWTPFLSSF